MLVKYNQMPPRVFVCAGDEGTTDWNLSQATGIPMNYKLADAWDFGPPTESFKHCSYAYHFPFIGGYVLATDRDPKLAVAADRNPWIMSPASAAGVWADFRPDLPPYSDSIKGGTRARVLCARRGNSITHRLDGQNVLFLDGRVTFERWAYCAVDKDNIYTVSSNVTGGGDPYGVQPVVNQWCMPTNREDSLLVHDPNTFPPYVPPMRK